MDGPAEVVAGRAGLSTIVSAESWGDAVNARRSTAAGCWAGMASQGGGCQQPHVDTTITKTFTRKRGDEEEVVEEEEEEEEAARTGGVCGDVLSVDPGTARWGVEPLAPGRPWSGAATARQRAATQSDAGHARRAGQPLTYVMGAERRLAPGRLKACTRKAASARWHTRVDWDHNGFGT